jgi:hypothetical protein
MPAPDSITLIFKYAPTVIGVIQCECPDNGLSITSAAM